LKDLPTAMSLNSTVTSRRGLRGLSSPPGARAGLALFSSYERGALSVPSGVVTARATSSAPRCTACSCVRGASAAARSEPALGAKSNTHFTASPQLGNTTSRFAQQRSHTHPTFSPVAGRGAGERPRRDTAETLTLCVCGRRARAREGTKAK
jgi:hypothetical protein